MGLFDKKKNQEEQEKPISPEESQMRHQSAPQPTAQDEVMKIRALQQQKMMEGQGVAPNGAVNGFNVLQQVIGREQVQKANLTLQKYKEGKANLETRIVENERWYKIRHWECMRDKSEEIQPASGWLFNCIENKHADCMDNFPSCNVLPREEGDKAQAEMLSSIIPVVLDQADFEETYSNVMRYKLKFGAGVYGVFWDKSKLNGLGDIAISKIDILNLFWEPGITDIQASRNVFHTELCDNEMLEQQYPQLQGKLGSATIDLTKYVYDDKVDTSNKSLVVDWYYKKVGPDGKAILHYCKYVNDEVLFATENDVQPVMDNMGNAVRPGMAATGWYDHGQYPFVFDQLFPTEGTLGALGYIDVAKDSQSYIDRGNQAIMQNMLASARPRYFIKRDGSVNEQEFADIKKDFIHVDGNLGQDSILPVVTNSLQSIHVGVVAQKIDELKETTGNRDVSTGGTSGGVTAASGLAAQMEAGSKLSRDSNKASYRSFRKLCVMVIELIRQFYDMPRCFRIMGENGVARYVQYSNAGITPQAQGTDFGVDMGYRLPQFDIEVTAQKQSPYSKMSQNELALQFYQAGFFNPQMADQALACLDMMDFDRKHFIMQKISQNGSMFQQMLQQMMMLAQMVDQMRGSNLAQQLAAQYGGGQPVAPIDGQAPSARVENTAALGGSDNGKEASTTKKARERVAESTSPT